MSKNHAYVSPVYSNNTCSGRYYGDTLCTAADDLHYVIVHVQYHFPCTNTIVPTVVAGPTEKKKKKKKA